jgi:hypothetical protein
MPIEWSPYPASLGHHPTLFWHFARAYFRRVAEQLRMALPCRKVSKKSDIRARPQRFLLTMGRVLLLTARMVCGAAHAFDAVGCQAPCLAAWWAMDAGAEEYVMEPSSTSSPLLVIGFAGA